MGDALQYLHATSRGDGCVLPRRSSLCTWGTLFRLWRFVDGNAGTQTALTRNKSSWSSFCVHACSAFCPVQRTVQRLWECHASETEHMGRVRVRWLETDWC